MRIINSLDIESMDCIFCKIVAGEIPSYKVYEDENVLAFLDIAPVSYGHTLIVPKQHFKNIEDISENELQYLILGVKRVAKILKDKLKISGYNLQINNDPVAGQIISHIHWHIIPRKEGDGIELWSQGKYNKGEAEEIIKKITE